MTQPAPQRVSSVVRTYDQLKTRVRETLIRAQQKIEKTRVLTYWNTGRYIHLHIEANGGRAEYGRRVILRLARDMKTGDDLLYRALRFYQAFPISASWRKLSWSHCRALARIPDARMRFKLTGRARRRLGEALFKKSVAITVTTTKPDKWDRYLADIFLLMPDQTEIFLNHWLLEQGLASANTKYTPGDWETE